MYKQRIEEYFKIHGNEMLESAMRLIRIKSDRGEAKNGMPYGEGPAAALKEALVIAEELGFKVKNYDNYVGTIDFNDSETQLDILAHLDTVPEGEGWNVTEALKPVIKDGMLYGRGAADDKGPAMCALYAMKTVKDLGVPLGKNVRLILGTDEECGSSDIKYYYDREKEAPMTFSPDAEFPLINIEKGSLRSGFKANFQETSDLPRLVSVKGGTKLNVVPDRAAAVIEGLKASEARPVCDEAAAETGLAFTLEETEGKLAITARGRGAHAAIPENGNNAVTGMIHLLSKLPLKGAGHEKLKAVAKLFPHGDWYGKGSGVAQEDELSGKLTISLNIINGTSQSLSVEFDSRCPLCANDSNMRKVLEEKGKALGLDLFDKAMNAPHYVDADSPFIKTLLGCYEAYTGLEGKCLAIGGGTYVHDLKNGVAFGCSLPGTDNRMHGADEFAVVDELILSAKIFAQAIIELCGEE